MLSLLQLFRRCFENQTRRSTRRRAAFRFDQGESLEVRALMSAVPAVEYPSTIRAGHTWYFSEESTANNLIETRGFGLPGDKYLAGDWNGDRRQDLVVVRPNAQGGLDWLIDLTADNIPDLTHKYGLSGDTPVLGDWDGNGTDDPGVARNNPATGLIDWYLDPTRTPNSNPRSRPFGLISRGDKPVVGDWNGDGKDTLGVAHSNPANGYLTWRLDANGDPTEDEVLNFGLWNTGDIPVVGDWNGDGKDNLGVVRTENGGLTWYLDLDKDPAAERTRKFGLAGDIPVAIERTASPSGSDPDDQFEEADRLHNLGKIVREVQFQDSISVKTDVDMLRFEVAAGQTVNFDIDTADNGPPGLGSYLRVFDAGGNELAANNDRLAPGDPPPNSHPDNDADGFDSYISYRFAKSGVYYVGVSNWQHFKYDPKTGRDEIAPSPKWLTGAYNLVITTDFVAAGTLSLSNAKFVGVDDRPTSRLSLNWNYAGSVASNPSYGLKLYYSSDPVFDSSDLLFKYSNRDRVITPSSRQTSGSTIIDLGRSPLKPDPTRPYVLVVAQPQGTTENSRISSTYLILPFINLKGILSEGNLNGERLSSLMKASTFTLDSNNSIQAESYSIEYRRVGKPLAGETVAWYPFAESSSPNLISGIHRLAGQFDFRAVVKVNGTPFSSEFYSTRDDQRLAEFNVRFPHISTIQADKNVQGNAELLFSVANLLSARTGYLKSFEANTGIYLNTAGSGSYILPIDTNDRRLQIDSLDFYDSEGNYQIGNGKARFAPYDLNVNPVYDASSRSALYTVAFFHTHPILLNPVGDLNIYARPVGPSEQDRKTLNEAASNSKIRIPGLVWDFIGKNDQINSRYMYTGDTGKLYPFGFERMEFLTKMPSRFRF